MAYATFRDLADRQYGTSTASRSLRGAVVHTMQQIVEDADDDAAYCHCCEARLTSTDIKAGHCTQCGKEI